MLAEAIASIKGAQQIVVADDGSTFDVRAVVDKVATTPVRYVLNPPISPEERATTHRPGKLFNRAIFAATQPILTYLCDDDLFTHVWIKAIAAFFAEHPGEHLVRGDCFLFGDPPTGPQEGFEWSLTTGNIAYRTTCADGPENCVWSEETIGVHDAVMINRLLATHRLDPLGLDVPYAGVQACWRRQHQFNMINYVNRAHPLGEYLPGAVDVLGGLLE